MAISPSRSTVTDGVNACTLPGMLTSSAGLQVRPPSRERENAIWSTCPPEKRDACQTAYTFWCPARGSVASIGRMSPVRTGSPVRGSTTPIVPSWSTNVGWASHVTPWSVDRTSATFNASPKNKANESMSVPSGSTLTMLPIVPLFVPGSKMACAGSKLAAPLTVRLKKLGSVKSGLVRSGWNARSHTAYTRFGSVGSAVMDSLSLNARGSVSRMTVRIGPHWWPPSRDLDTRTAFVGLLSLKDRLMKYESPLGADVTHG